MKLTDKQLSVLRNRIVLRARNYGYSKEFDEWWLSHSKNLNAMQHVCENLTIEQASHLIDKLFKGEWKSVIDLFSSFAMDSGVNL